MHTDDQPWYLDADFDLPENVEREIRDMDNENETAPAAPEPPAEHFTKWIEQNLGPRMASAVNLLDELEEIALHAVLDHLGIDAL